MIQKPIGWYFPKHISQSIERVDKFIDSKFAIDPWMSFTREVIQNSLDAKNPNNDLPVRITFEHKALKLEDIPGAHRLKTIIDLCAKQTTSRQTQISYSNAVKILNQTYIDCLKVSDYNTTGIIEGRNNKWGKLLNNSGSSEKSRPDSAGSHGLGKRTSFMISMINTVFYSTLYSNALDDEQVTLFQGRSILINWQAEDNGINSLDGWYGSNDDNRDPLEVSLPLRNDETKNIHNFFIRKKDIGADVIIPAIPISTLEEVKAKIVLSTIENFFVAIKENKITVEVFGVLIDSKTLLDITRIYYEKYTPVELKNRTGNLRNGNLIKYFEAYLYSEPKIIPIHYKDQNYGNLRIYLANDIKDNFKFYSLFRSHGMKIQDNSVKTDKPFAAVIIIQGERLNELLLKIENPAHDDFETDSKYVITDEEQVNLAKELAKKVWKTASNFIQSNTKINYEDEYYIDDVSSFLSIQGSLSSIKKALPTKIKSRKTKSKKNDEDGTKPVDVSGGSGTGKAKTRKKSSIYNEKLVTVFDIEPTIIFKNNQYQLSFKTKREMKKVNIYLTAENLSGGTNKFPPILKEVFQNGKAIDFDGNYLKNVDLIDFKIGNINLSIKTKKLYKLVPEIYAIKESDEVIDFEESLSDGK